MDEARVLLTSAVQIREATGDRAGAEVSRHNLGLITVAAVPLAPPDPPPARNRGRAVRRAISFTVAVLGAIVLVATAVEALFLGDPKPTAADAPTTAPTTWAFSFPPPPSEATGTRGTTPATDATSPATTAPPVRVRPPGLAPARYAFAGVDVTPGGPVARQTFVVTNRNGDAVTMAASRTDGDGAYTIGSDGCLGRTLGSGGQCRVTVAFGPAAIGAHTGALIVADTRGRSSSAALTGTGFALLTVTVTGDGTVAGGNGLVDCAGSCKVQLTELGQSPVTLTATPGDSDFTGWSGVCNPQKTEPACAVTVTRDTEVGAAFTAVIVTD